MDTFIYIALSQIIVVLVLILSNLKRQKLNRNLILFLIFGFGHIVTKILVYEFVDDSFVRYGTFNSFSFGYTPVFFLFIYEIYFNKILSKKSQLLHFSPFILFTVIYGVLVIYFILNGFHPFMKFYTTYGYYILTIQFMIYPCLSMYYCLKGFKKKSEISYLFKYSFFISSLLLVLGMFNLIDSVKLIDFNYAIATRVSYITLALTFVLVIHMFFYSKVGDIIEDVEEEVEIAKEEKQLKEKYKNSGLREEQFDEIMSRILDYLQNKKVYLNSDYKLEHLAKDLDLPKHHISQVLNVKMEINFYGLLNQFRVEEFTKMLKTHEESRPNLLKLAYESGFSSKSTFNSNFKKLMGCTPTEYINKLD